MGDLLEQTALHRRSRLLQSRPTHGFDAATMLGDQPRERVRGSSLFEFTFEEVVVEHLVDECSLVVGGGTQIEMRREAGVLDRAVAIEPDELDLAGDHPLAAVTEDLPVADLVFEHDQGGRVGVAFDLVPVVDEDRALLQQRAMSLADHGQGRIEEGMAGTDQGRGMTGARFDRGLVEDHPLVGVDDHGTRAGDAVFGLD